MTPAPSTSPTAAALIIGNEILTGKIADKNLSVLATRLRKLGVRLLRANTILDDVMTIASEVRALARDHTWVVTSGGVGPTHDDVTIEAVARAFGRNVVVSAELESMLHAAYGEKLRPGHLMMARIPEGARLVCSPEIPWPCVLCENVFVLPGVPEIFELKLSLVAAEIGASAGFVSLAVLSSLDEGHLKPFLDRVVGEHPHIEVGSYPRWGDAEWRTKVTFDGLDENEVRRARDAFTESLPGESRSRAEG